MKRIPAGTETAPEHLAALGSALGFMRLLWAVSHGLESTSKRMQTELGVTGPQRLVLRIVGQNPDIAPGELASVLHVHPSSLTGVLQRLIRIKLLRRHRDPKDGRRSTLTLTAAGRHINARRVGTVEATVQRTLARVSPAQLEATEKVLRLLAAELDSASYL